MILKALVLRKLLALRLLKTGFLVVLMAGSGSNLQAQSEYLTHIRPTFWYNSIDGVKAGVRFFWLSGHSAYRSIQSSGRIMGEHRYAGSASFL